MATACKMCEEVMGFHSLRQVDQTGSGSPVFFMCMAQSQGGEGQFDSEWENHVEYCLENRIGREDKPIVWIINFAGWSPRSQSLHTIFTPIHESGFASRLFLLNTTDDLYEEWDDFDQRGLANTQFLSAADVTKQKFLEFNFTEELAVWLSEENHDNNKATQDQTFWLPVHGGHDPRGVPSFVRENIEPWSRSELETGKPHPSILKSLRLKSGKEE